MASTLACPLFDIVGMGAHLTNRRLPWRILKLSSYEREEVAHGDWEQMPVRATFASLLIVTSACEN